MNPSIITILGTSALYFVKRNVGSSVRLKRRNVNAVEHNVMFEVSEWEQNLNLDAISDSINKILLKVSFKEMDDFYIWQQIYFDWHDTYHAIWEEWEGNEDAVYKGGFIRTYISNKNGYLNSPLDNFIPTESELNDPKEIAFLDRIYGDYMDMIFEVLDGSVVQYHRTGDGFYENIEYGILLKEDNSPYFIKSSTIPKLRKR